MPINWFPGHMVKASRLIKEAIGSTDVVIEVLDARMPYASQNPVIAQLGGNTPCVKVLSKSDLADPDATREWVTWFEKSGRAAKVISITTEKQNDTRTRVGEAVRAVAKLSRGRKNPRALIVGIPNVGKSTLVNTLAKRKIAKTGDEPAVTKSIQVVTLDDGIILSDNPGIMWPKIQDDTVGYILALGGSIPDTAIDYETLGDFAAELLFHMYPDAVMTRYKLKERPTSGPALLEEIGRRRGCLRPGNIVDRQKAAGILVHDLRSGALGRITLERPRDYAEV